MTEMMTNNPMVVFGVVAYFLFGGLTALVLWRMWRNDGATLAWWLVVLTVTFWPPVLMLVGAADDASSRWPG